MKKIVKQKKRLTAAKPATCDTAPSSPDLAFLTPDPEVLASQNSHMRRTLINTGYFSIRKIIPLSASCHACAIIPTRRLFRHHESTPNINP
jgi:hypothetical protein